MLPDTTLSINQQLAKPNMRPQGFIEEPETMNVQGQGSPKRIFPTLNPQRFENLWLGERQSVCVTFNCHLALISVVHCFDFSAFEFSERGDPPLVHTSP
jgi:hypothetical protein